MAGGGDPWNNVVFFPPNFISVHAITADGVVTNIPLVLGTNWFEIDPILCPGLYHLLLPTSVTSVLGPVQWYVLDALDPVTQVNFVTFVGAGVVEDPSKLCKRA
jgi:hypothetical protein